MFPSYKRTNPPFWLEENKLFRKLYAFRRLIHTTTVNYFSDTDEYIERVFRHLESCDLVSCHGFFVDVGCFYPTQENTTYVLYQRGWRGINIDVDQIKIDAFNLRRPLDVNIVCAVSDRVGIAKYWRKGLWSRLNSLERLKLAHEQDGWIEIEVETITLTQLIDQTVYRNRPIDFLSVDVEGHDLKVLKQLDFDLYCPKVICVESWASEIGEVMQDELYTFVASKGYRLVNWINRNLIFLHQDFPLLSEPGVLHESTT